MCSTQETSRAIRSKNNNRGEIRLQRFLAQAGVASRRKAEELISAGRVTVNGRSVTELGSKVDPLNDRVAVDGRRVQSQQPLWLVLNKPPATVCTADDPEGRQTVFDVIGRQGVRLFSVGRLDYHTQGVLLLTNDGDLANALLAAKNTVAKIYHAKVQGLVEDATLQPLRDGVVLDGKRVSGPTTRLAHTGKHTWVEVILHQGLNRQVHRMMEAVGLRVLKLIRVSFGGVNADGLAPGEYRELKASEIELLRRVARGQAS